MARYKWDLHTDGITQSGLRKWMECREQFYLAYVEGWTAKESSGPLDFGARVHEILARAKGNSAVAGQLINKMKRKIRRDKSIPAASRETLVDRISVIEIMLRKYFWFWAKEDRRRRWKSREETFKVTTDIAGPVALILRGRKDGIYFFSRKECLQEIKTSGRVDERGTQSSLHLMFQPMFYSYAHYLETGKVPHKVLYDLIRRPQLRPKQDESPDAFLQRLQEDVRIKRPAFYFHRWEVSLTKERLTDWVKTVLRGLLLEFTAWYDDVKSRKSRFDSPRHFINPDALTTKGGGHSEFFELLTRGSTYGLYRRDVPFPELED